MNHQQQPQFTTPPEHARPMQPTAAPTQAMPPGFFPRPPARKKVRRIRARHTLFKVAFGGIVLAAVLFIVGFSVSAWAGNSGLWMRCRYGCYSNLRRSPSWLDAVRAMETLALICVLSSIAMVLYQDVFKSPPPAENKAVEILGGLAAMFGLIGIIIFGAKLDTSELVYKSYGFYISFKSYFNWGFGLAAAGSILILIYSCLIAYSRIKHAAKTSMAMANLRVYTPAPRPSAPSMMPMQPMEPRQVPSAPEDYQPHTPSYPYPLPYAHPYPYPYPATPSTPLTAPPVSATPFSAPSTGPQADASRQVVPTSQIPVCYVITQGQPVPVFSEVSAIVNTAQSTAASPIELTVNLASPDTNENISAVV